MGDQRSGQTNILESSRQQSATPVSKPPILSQGAAHPLLQLQRQLGNRAVTQLIQAKLSVSQPNDRYEQEADRVADTVMRMPDPIVQRQPSEEEAIQAAPIERLTPLMQRQVEEEEEPVQMLQRQVEEEEPVQMLQRQVEEEEPVQAKQAIAQTPEVTSDLETRIQSMRGGGQTLPASTRAFFEPRFGYDFSSVRVHTDSQANDVAQRLNAQAFTLQQDVFFGAGRYQPDTSQGRWLLAHELTHTVQQQPQPLASAQSTAQRQVQAVSPTPNQLQRRLPVSPAAPQIQRSLIDDALDWIADKAAYIPGYTLLTVVIGRNPINNRRVDPTPTNLLQGVLELVPVVGRLLFQALQASGAIDRVFNWVRQEIGQLNLTWEAIVAAFRRVDLSWDDAFSPRAAYRRFEREFSPIIDRVVRFARSVKDRVITFIKEAILTPISNFAKRLPIYPLLTVILGKDPITDETVPRTATNVIRGILMLLPGGEERFQNLQRSGIIDRAFNWFNQELTRLNLTWNFIKSVFVRVWDALSVSDLLSPIVAFNRIVGIFSEPVQRVISFAGSAIRKVAEFIFEGVLTLAGGLGQRVLGIFNRARSVISTIIENPIGFVGNLVNAVKRGFQQFAQRDRLLNHLRTGLVAWLMGSLRGSGLQLPERFDLRGIVSLVMQILGLTYANLRGILVRLADEETVSRAEGVFGFLVTLVRDGLAAAWQQIVEFAGNLQETVMGGIRDWVTRTVVGQAVVRLVTLFNPAGAIIQAIMAVYNTVVFFIERARQIGELAEAVFNSIATIASGNISAAANFVEQTMARSIPVILGFLARFMNLGGISEQIGNVVRRIQAPVNRAMERVADWIITQVRRLGGAIVSGARSVVQRVVNWLELRKSFQTRDASQHSLFTEMRNGQPVLMLASNEQPFSTYLQNLTVPASETEKVQAKQTAIGSHGRITTKLTHLKTMEATFGETLTSTQRGQLNQTQAELRSEYDTLSDQVKILGIAGSRSETVLTRIDPTSGSKLTYIAAEPLTALRGNTVGNPNANRVRGVSGWSFLDRINVARGNDNTIYNDWVRWHLIHSGLHGPAEVFNLVAAPRGINTRFASQVEHPVLRRVLEPGTMLYYRVNIVYGNSAPPLDDFPTSITYTWGTMRMDNNQPVEDRQVDQKTYSGFPLPAMPTTGGLLTVKLKNAGRPFMQNTLRIPKDRAHRIAKACTEYSHLDAHGAMDAYYALPNSLFGSTPFSNYLATDKAAIASAQVQHHGTYIIDLT